MTELQQKLLLIYNYFKRICDNINITYYAAGGTLLGTIRHKGFIPWDDDMDIYMPRDDYNKLVEFSKSFYNEEIFIQNHYTDKEWMFPFTKIRLKNTTAIEAEFEKASFHQGIWIDVFPLDEYVGNSKILCLYERKRKQLLRRIFIHYKRKTRFFGFLYNVLILLKYPTLKKTYKKLIKLATKFNGNPNASFLGTIWDRKTDQRMLFDKKFFLKKVELPFENTVIYVPEQYESVLRSQYGDWNIVPPPEKRKSGHTIKILDSKNNYTVYLPLKR